MLKLCRKRLDISIDGHNNFRLYDLCSALSIALALTCDEQNGFASIEAIVANSIDWFMIFRTQYSK